MSIDFKVKAFQELTLEELYDLLQLRQEIFIVEQNCPYQDADGKDLKSYHVLAYDRNKLVAYTRIVPPKISYEKYASIGRVVCLKAYRSTGLGKKIMKISIDKCQVLYASFSIKISAQVYIEKFYKDLGFKATGEPYLEDDIPHQAMIL